MTDRNDWSPMSDAPRDGTIFRAEILGCGDRHLIAWTEGIGVDDNDQPCGAWVHHGPGEPPPCWSDGACWDSNADGSMSAPPVRWMPAPSDLTDAQARMLGSAYTARNGSRVAKITSRTYVVACALERKGLGRRQMDYFVLNEAGIAAALVLEAHQ